MHGDRGGCEKREWAGKEHHRNPKRLISERGCIYNINALSKNKIENFWSKHSLLLLMIREKGKENRPTIKVDNKTASKWHGLPFSSPGAAINDLSLGFSLIGNGRSFPFTVFSILFTPALSPLQTFLPRELLHKLHLLLPLYLFLSHFPSWTGRCFVFLGTFPSSFQLFPADLIFLELLHILCISWFFASHINFPWRRNDQTKHLLHLQRMGLENCKFSRDFLLFSSIFYWSQGLT